MGFDPNGMLSRIPAEQRLNVFALVIYIPDSLGRFLDDLRRELVPGCNPHAHVSVLPPRPLAVDWQVAGEQVRVCAGNWAPFDIVLGRIRIFTATNRDLPRVGRERAGVVPHPRGHEFAGADIRRAVRLPSAHHAGTGDSAGRGGGRPPAGARTLGGLRRAAQLPRPTHGVRAEYARRLLDRPRGVFARCGDRLAPQVSETNSPFRHYTIQTLMFSVICEYSSDLRSRTGRHGGLTKPHGIDRWAPRGGGGNQSGRRRRRGARTPALDSGGG